MGTNFRLPPPSYPSSTRRVSQGGLCCACYQLVNATYADFAQATPPPSNSQPYTLPPGATRPAAGGGLGAPPMSSLSLPPPPPPPSPKAATAAPAHAFNLTAAPLVDSGRVGGWAIKALSNGGFQITPNATVSGAVTISATAALAKPPPVPAWFQLWNVDGVSLTAYDAPITAAPGLNVSSLGVASNANAGSAFCSQGVFVDASPTVNGAAYPSSSTASAGRRMLLATTPYPAFTTAPFTITLIVDKGGNVGVPTSGLGGAPYLAIPFPKAAGAPSPACQVVTLPAGSSITVGAGSASAAAFPGNVSFFSIDV